MKHGVECFKYSNIHKYLEYIHAFIGCFLASQILCSLFCQFQSEKLQPLKISPGLSKEMQNEF